MYAGERFNSISHLVGAALALIGVTVMVTLAGAEGGALRIVSFSVYGATLFLLYLFSTLYHSLRGRAKAVFRVLDHHAIYLLIAGTYTPFTLLVLKGATGWWMFGAVWGSGADRHHPGLAAPQGSADPRALHLSRHGLAGPPGPGPLDRRPPPRRIPVAAWREDSSTPSASSFTSWTTAIPGVMASGTCSCSPAASVTTSPSCCFSDVNRVHSGDLRVPPTQPMARNPTSSRSGRGFRMDTRLKDILSRCLLLDLETGPTGEIHKIGAVYRDSTFLRQGRFETATALTELDTFAADANWCWATTCSGMTFTPCAPGCRRCALLQRPVIDTLFLSPLVFPENPYHRLVKDYKLVRATTADPVADCHLAARIFGEQWDELTRRAANGERELLQLYRFCFRGALDLESAATGGSGIALVFGALGADLPDVPQALALLRRHWAGRTCATASRPLALKYFTDPRLRPVVAYATAWLLVSGARSVLPPWVRHRFPDTLDLLRALRDRPCAAEDCAWCRATHDPRAQLKRFFGFDQFRPLPMTDDGQPLQEAIVTHGMAEGSQLAILPTGGGKSLCFQLPALARNQRRGVLTLVISPLQALMKDQVDNLSRKTGTTSAAALYGMLTQPERGDVLERVRLGDVAILYVSPEQLRNASFRQVLESREIGAWVFDEAHCLSKWGHDFRPDYLYASRFIRDLAKRQGLPIPPIACFTATAKTDVIEEVIAHFRTELQVELQLFQGGVERDNLTFEVQLTRRIEKQARLHEVLQDHLIEGGAAVVYASSRASTEELAKYLRSQGWRVDDFHAGRDPPRKATNSGCLRRRRTPGDLRHQRLRHGRGQGECASGGPCRHPRIGGELHPGGRPRRARPPAGALRPALRREGHRGSVLDWSRAPS